MKRFNQYVKALRWALAIVMCVVYSVTAWAGGSTNYYFKANAYVSPTGGGKVYISNLSNSTPDYQDSFESAVIRNGDSRSITLYYFAQANPGYQFNHWAQTANGQSQGTGNPQRFDLTINNNSTRTSNATVFTYYAVFDKQTGVVQAQVGTGVGNASVSISDNKVGDQVTLTATPSNDEDYAFIGWTRNDPNSTNYISDAGSTYQFTITSDNIGTYYAHFRKQDKAYIRLQNISSGKFLSLYGNSAASEHYYDNQSDNPDGFTFDGSLKLISETEAQGNPMTVFMMIGKNNGTEFSEGNLKAAGVAYSSLINNASYPLTIHGNYVYTTHGVKTKNFYIEYKPTNGNNTYYLNTSGQFTTTPVEWEMDDEGYLFTESNNVRHYLSFNGSGDAYTQPERPSSTDYKFAIVNGKFKQIGKDYYIRQYTKSFSSTRMCQLSTADKSRATYGETNKYSSLPSNRYSYLCADGSENVVMKTVVTKDPSQYKNTQYVPEGAEWRIIELTEDGATQGAFGANAKAANEKDGKYYTTMFSYFPYKLSSGVKAYYLPMDENLSYDRNANKVTLTEVPDDIVPANTAVVLECDAVQDNSVNNLLYPIVDESTVQALGYENLLRGYNYVVGRDQQIANDSENMYILATKNGKLAFYHSSGTYMSPNKAFLDLTNLPSDLQQAAKNASFVFGDIDDEEEGTVTGITVATDNNSTDAPIYDLSGRKVENPGRGIYIRNNKKFVVK